jgi:aspartyl-tRNA(Asn)/glutamyl-tRNA(Gln) amidotransferase subunit C
MPIDPDDVRAIARLARLALADGEIARMQEELGAILDSFAIVDRVGAPGAAQAHRAVEVETPFRKDVPGDPAPAGAALRGAPVSEGGMFAVPCVIGKPDPRR